MAYVNLFKTQLDILNFYFAHRIKKPRCAKRHNRNVWNLQLGGGIPETSHQQVLPQRYPRTVPVGYLSSGP